MKYSIVLNYEGAGSSILAISINQQNNGIWAIVMEQDGLSTRKKTRVFYPYHSIKWIEEIG